MDRPASSGIAFPLIVCLILIAAAFGGGGIGAAGANLVVQLAALIVLALQHGGVLRFWREAPLPLRALVAATITLPLLQIIPLPEPVWTGLPSRALVSDALALAGDPHRWMPFSLDPLRTLLALTALVTPVAVLWAGWALPRERLIDCGWVVVAIGLVTVLLGAVQLSSGSDAGTLYGSEAPSKVLLGTFANRNSTGLFLTFALGLAALLPAPRPHPLVLPARLAACALLLLTVVLTQSRTALVLALLPAGLGTLRAASALARSAGQASPRRAVMIGLGALALIGAAGGALAIAAPDRLAATLERFEAKDDPRRYIWDDATYTAGRYWPLGAGVGTFDTIYQVDESLENLTLRRAGRVHNDYIELTIEAGAPGLVLAALWLMLVGWLSWQVRTSSQRWAAWAGSAFLLAIALQSITDYPLRNQTILAVTGYGLLLLARIAADQRKARI